MSVFVEKRAPFEIPQYARGVEIAIQVLDETGIPVDLTSVTDIEFFLLWKESVPPIPISVAGTATVVSAADGKINYVSSNDNGTPPSNDFDRVGQYEGEFRLKNGTTEWFVYPVRPKLDIRVTQSISGKT
jgi:hypothetical protein